ncbi:Cytochrome P450 71D7 [Linum perenne]
MGKKSNFFFHLLLFSIPNNIIISYSTKLNQSSHLAHKYGPDSVKIHLGELLVLAVSSPEASKLVLKTHDIAFCSSPSNLFAINILHDGFKNIVFSLYDENRRQMRKIIVLELLTRNESPRSTESG